MSNLRIFLLVNRCKVSRNFVSFQKVRFWAASLLHGGPWLQPLKPCPYYTSAQSFKLCPTFMAYTINHIQQNLSISIDEKAALKMLMKLTRNQPKFGDENSFESFPPIPFITKENNLEFICYFNIFVSFIF